MKKTIAILMLGVLLFSCAGCIYANEAPTLYIRLGDQTIEQSGTVFNYNKKGLFYSTEELSSLVSPTDLDYTPIRAQAETISFELDEKPKKMSLCYYKVEPISEFESTLIEPSGNEWPLQEDENIYELIVTWENMVSSRVARYTFYISM